MGRVHVVSLLSVLTVVLPTPALAQQVTSQISGRIAAAPGAALPGVAVVVRNEETGVSRELTSSGEGTYSAAQLPPGRYSVVAQLSGFRTVGLTRLARLVGTTPTIELPLPLGGTRGRDKASVQGPP